MWKSGSGDCLVERESDGEKNLNREWKKSGGGKLQPQLFLLLLLFMVPILFLLIIIFLLFHFPIFFVFICNLTIKIYVIFVENFGKLNLI